MPISESDPRVFFAAERTLLAWLRTGLTVIGLGFVIARFGLFLQLLSLQAPLAAAYGHHGASAILGVSFVVIGAVAILVSTIQHKRFVATLTALDLPPSYNRSVAVFLSSVVGVLGLLLAAYLLASS